MRLTLKYCCIADVEFTPPKESDSQRKDRIVKIDVDEEDFFAMLDSVNPKNIVKYLDMRNINHRDGVEINIYKCKRQKPSERNRRKLNRCLELIDAMKTKEKL
ncbi:MAG: hypothetical protein J6O49_21965 [Bacteroidaceae bacterium]|nr:hypothetical protein [Bacteroidaceae bacterium]